MGDCSKHKKEVAGISDMKVLAEMIGDLHYETMQDLFLQVSLKLAGDAGKDCNEGRTKLGIEILDAAIGVLKSHQSVKKAWQISKPFMEK